MKRRKYKVVPILYGFEKDPGEDLVVSIEIRHVSLEVLQDIFQDNLEDGLLIITKKYEPILYKKIDIKINTDKLDLFIGLGNDE
jgi:hypothetical protein